MTAYYFLGDISKVAFISYVTIFLSESILTRTIGFAEQLIFRLSVARSIVVRGGGGGTQVGFGGSPHGTSATKTLVLSLPYDKSM